MTRILDESRFQTAKSTLFIDKFMSYFIKGGGIAVIAAVLCIFVFIFAQIFPLFQKAKVSEYKTISLDAGQSYIQMGADEWGELPFFLKADGQIDFVDTHTGLVQKSEKIPLKDKEEITTVEYDSANQYLFLGTNQGHFYKVFIEYKPVFNGDDRTIVAKVKTDKPLIVESGRNLEDLDFVEFEEIKVLGSLYKKDGKSQVKIMTLSQSRSLFGAGEIKVGDSFQIADQLSGSPKDILISSSADNIFIVTENGMIDFFTLRKDEISLTQSIMPFKNETDKKIASANFILGDVSIVLTNAAGLNEIYSLYIPEGKNTRLLGKTKSFDPFEKGIEFYHHGTRNKSFLTGVGNFVSLRYATTEAIRWEKELPFKVEKVLIGGKYGKLYFFDDQNKLHIYKLKDEHPESGMKAFFQKIWYEGYAGPGYEWQSTGGTDDFEPKLSLVPLVFGTLKGTFYAMLFALPIAVLAALYISQFASYRVRTVVKPIMEIMAALPSVVLGFLAALWLAPLIEEKVPSMLLTLIVLPLSALAFGSFFSGLNPDQKKFIKEGREWVFVIPLCLITISACWYLGPWVERIFFTVEDISSGQKIADFRLWWTMTTGLAFEQRNSLVVGFIMGFAVIPIIFTIAEDSLSNVPKTLKAGSLALGASRWQTAFRVILPTAFPGIFSATMIGFGRAVGETMIVVMATGNTSIMEWNIFNGFRTLSANIAVELPEAPYLGTLYRTLFLGAMVLFLMTFIVNTIAEVIRQKLREKYKTV